MLAASDPPMSCLGSYDLWVVGRELRLLLPRLTFASFRGRSHPRRQVRAASAGIRPTFQPETTKGYFRIPPRTLFATSAATPISRNTFRTRVWLPAVKASGVSFNVRMHDLRHAHASWLLAGGADLKTVMDRLGHAQIQTTQKYLHALAEADQRSIDALDA